MKTVLTGGKFNKIHPGHIWLLKKAKKLGDRLVVILANDNRNERPYAIAAVKRKEQLAKLGIADEIVIGHKHDFTKVISKFKPSIIVLGYDQELPESLKGKLDKNIKIMKFKKHKNYSTGKMP